MKLNRKAKVLQNIWKHILIFVVIPNKIDEATNS